MIVAHSWPLFTSPRCCANPRNTSAFCPLTGFAGRSPFHPYNLALAMARSHFLPVALLPLRVTPEAFAPRGYQLRRFYHTGTPMYTSFYPDRGSLRGSDLP